MPQRPRAMAPRGPDLDAPALHGALRLAGQAADIETHAALEAVLFPGVGHVVGCDGAFLTHVDVTTNQEATQFWPRDGGPRELWPAYSRLAHTHPLRPGIEGQARRPSATVRPIRTSEVLSMQRWRASALRTEVLRDVSDQMSVLLAAERGVMRVLTLSRTRGTFSDRQLDLLAAVRVHLGAAVRRADPAGQRAVQFSPTLGEIALGSAPGMNGRSSSGLTRRQHEVLELVACGLTDAQIARRLDLSPRTVGKHLQRLYAQLGVPGRAAAAAHWTRHAA